MTQVAPLAGAAEVLPGNGLVTTLANGIAASDTTLNIQPADATTWPSSGNYRAVLCQDPLNGPFELVAVTGGQGSSTLQVTRAAESYNGSTTPRAWPPGTTISAVLTQAGLAAYLLGNSPGVSFPLLAPDGAPSAPSYAFSGLPGSGMRKAGNFLAFEADQGTLYMAGATASQIMFNAYWTGSAWASWNGVQLSTYMGLGLQGLYVGTAPAGNPNGFANVFQVDPNGNVGVGITVQAGYALHVQGNARVTGTGQITGNAGLGTVPATNIGMSVSYATLTDTAPYGAYITQTLSSAATGSSAGLGVQIVTAANLTTSNAANVGPAGIRVYQPSLGGSNTINALYGIRVDYQSVTGIVLAYGIFVTDSSGVGTFDVGQQSVDVGVQSVTATQAFGVYVANQGRAGLNNAYGLYVAAQSGAGVNIGLYNAGTTQLNGNVSIAGNQAPSASTGILGWFNALSGSSQAGMNLTCFFTSTATTSAVCIQTAFNTVSASFSMPNGYGIWLGASSIGSGVTVTTLYGLRIDNQGAAGITTAYGLYIAQQSGASSTNVGLYNLGTTQFMAPIGVGQSPLTSAALYINYAAGNLAGLNEYAVNIFANFTTSATSQGVGISLNLNIFGSFTMASSAGVRVVTPTIAAGTTVSQMAAIQIDNQGGAGITNAYGLYVVAQSGATSDNASIVAFGDARIGGVPGAQLAVGATVGFLYIPNMPGTPTGIPARYHVGGVGAGASPLLFDNVSNRLWLYENGKWYYVQMT